MAHRCHGLSTRQRLLGPPLHRACAPELVESNATRIASVLHDSNFRPDCAFIHPIVHERWVQLMCACDETIETQPISLQDVKLSIQIYCWHETPLPLQGISQTIVLRPENP